MKISKNKFDELISKIKDMYDETYVIYIGSTDDGGITEMYEFCTDLEIAKQSSLIFEGDHFDDVIEAQPYMHHETNSDEAWEWLLEGGLEEDLSDIIHFDEKFDYENSSVDEIIEYLHITNE